MCGIFNLLSNQYKTPTTIKVNQCRLSREHYLTNELEEYILLHLDNK